MPGSRENNINFNITVLGARQEHGRCIYARIEYDLRSSSGWSDLYHSRAGSGPNQGAVNYLAFYGSLVLI